MKNATALVCKVGFWSWIKIEKERTILIPMIPTVTSDVQRSVHLHNYLGYGDLFRNRVII